MLFQERFLLEGSWGWGRHPGVNHRLTRVLGKRERERVRVCACVGMYVYVVSGREHGMGVNESGRCLMR